ncbi:flavin-containing monooxygenase [Mastigocladopsis repens]|uniref:flavin-containing monooxygenase n=1 Tax=Mastigocladopsis repens TaxID=221287 RepID=UPI00031351C9|nr:NAD(P)/FAD-dependent oxidoreductase [Mastigocladopsis repens]
MTVKQICVIGAGISGLVAAKTFIEEGYDVTVFEKQKGLGGVWEKSRTYPELTAQNPRDTYAFSDYPMPASYPEWPTAEQMWNYLQSYAHHFGVTERICFGAEVTKVSRRTGGQLGWVISVSYQDNNQRRIREEKHEFDFVLVCNGVFNIPKIPSLPGQEEFIASGGRVLHSTEFNDASVIKGKHVIVVGFGKSATDIANFAATQALECTLVFRNLLWKVPRFFLSLVNVKYILLTRFAEAWLPYRQLQGLERVLHTVGKPLVWAFWRTNETLIRLQFGLDANRMLPDIPLNKFVGCTANVAAEGFYKHVRSGKIRAKKTSIARFVTDGVELANGERLQANVVIFGTGFRQDISFLEENDRRLVIDHQGNFHLYRHLIHPDIPQMGFVGYNSSLFCQLTSEIGAWWLVEYFKGNLVLPSALEMHKEIEAEFDWVKTEGHFIQFNGTCIAPFAFRHLEQLLQDMGVNNHHSSWNRIAQMMMPVDPSVYKKLRQELRAKRRPSVNNSH